MAIIALDNVTLRYRDRHREIRALDGVSLATHDRELLVLLGPSGCGKTSALRVIAGLEAPTSGVVRIGNKVANEMPPRDRDVAMVFQNLALYPHMTVYKNLAFGLTMRGESRATIDDRVRNVASMLEIDDVLLRKPGTLSGGQQQRVALGRAMVRKPRAFLFDEPLSSLDAPMRARLRTELKRLHRRLETTAIHVTHDQEEALMMGDRIAVMDRGQIHQCGSPIEIYDRPADRFVAGFVGTPPMNFLQGRLERQGDHWAFSGPTGRLSAISASNSNFVEDPGREVMLGIRPEHFRIERYPPDSSNNQDILDSRWVSIGSWRIDLIEPVGDVSNVHLVTESEIRLIARVPTEGRCSAGTRVAVTVRRDRLHFFNDDAQGRRIETSPRIESIDDPRLG